LRNDNLNQIWRNLVGSQLVLDSQFDVTQSEYILAYFGDDLVILVSVVVVPAPGIR